LTDVPWTTHLIAIRMILLLIAAIAAIALLAALGLKVTRAHARQRREELASARRAAEASHLAAEAAARAEDERRQAWADADALTSVIPAIRMPWPTQLPGSQSHGYPDLDGEYPGFSTRTPFGAAPVRGNGKAGGAPPGPAPQVPPPRAGETGPVEPEPPYPATPERGPFETANGLPRRRPPAEPGPPPTERRWPGTRPGEPVDEQMMPAQGSEEYRLPRRGPAPRPAPPNAARANAARANTARAAAADQPLAPLPRADEPVTTAVPGEPGDRLRKRPTHGSHRGGHAKRRRG
jgi:hypothetical protein